MALIFGAILLAGLAVVLAFGKFTSAIFEKWLVAEGALGSAYITGNVVSKLIDGKRRK